MQHPDLLYNTDIKYLQHTSEISETLETYASNMRFQRNVTLLLGRMEARRCGARHRRGGQQQCMELAGAAVARATRRRGGVTRSSSCRLLTGASVVVARQLDGGGHNERVARSRRPRRAGNAATASGRRGRGGHGTQMSGVGEQRVEKKHSRDYFFRKGRTWERAVTR